MDPLAHPQVRGLLWLFQSALPPCPAVHFVSGLAACSWSTWEDSTRWEAGAQTPLCAAPPFSRLTRSMLKEHVDILKALGSWGPSLMKMVQGFQAEFCINPAGLAPPSQPPQQQQVAVGGRVGSIPAGLNGHPHSHPPPSSTAENFPPLGAPRTSPPSTAGAVNRSASASQRKEGNAEGRVVSSDSSGQGESQGEGLGQAREGHAGQGIEGKDSGVGAGGEEKKAGKEGSTADGLATETVAPPAVEASAAAETATATATATAAPTEAGTGGVEALTDQGRLREASGAARPTVNGAGQVQGTAEDTSEESPRASNGTASTSDDGRLVSRPSGEVRAASLSESGAQGLMGEDSQGRKPGQTRIREAPLLCASCSIEPACMVSLVCLSCLRLVCMSVLLVHAMMRSAQRPSVMVLFNSLCRVCCCFSHKALIPECHKVLWQL